MKKYKIKQPLPQFGENVTRTIEVPYELVKEIRADVIEEYNKSLKYHWIEEEDLSLSDDFFNYVDRIAEQLKEEDNENED